LEIKLETPSSATVAVVSDEMSKLNVNRLVNRSSAGPGIEEVNGSLVETFRRLFETIEIDPALVDAIVDWQDYDDEERTFGAEQSYYDTLDPPIRCKNGPLDSVGELANVKGFDEGILYGTEDKPGLVKFVTVCGPVESLININTASEEVIAAMLNSETLASLIVDDRETNPFANAEDVVARFPDANPAGRFTTWSSYFSVSSRADVPSAESPTRQLTIWTLLKRNRAEQTVEDDQSGIDTLSWKIER
jgi:general secretion pathway protein K